MALGAAASTSQTSVQLIVFVAIMLHKVSEILVEDLILNILIIKISLSHWYFFGTGRFFSCFHNCHSFEIIDGLCS